MAAAISPGASAPWTRTGTTATSAMGQRAPKMRSMSRTAAPAGEVTRAMRVGDSGAAASCGAGSKSPSCAELVLELLKGHMEVPHAVGGQLADSRAGTARPRGNTDTRPKATTFMPFSGRNRSAEASRRNMTQRMAPPSSFKEK